MQASRHAGPAGPRPQQGKGGGAIAPLSWTVPAGIVERTVGALSGRDAEVFALWTAPLAAPSPPGIQSISRVVVPEQEPHAGPRGPSVRVPGEELRRIAFDNYARGERCAVQIHTHPSADTRMSALDMKWEVVAHPGALSIIVPDYCRDGARSFWRASVYERGAGGRWTLWGGGEIAQRIEVR